VCPLAGYQQLSSFVHLKKERQIISAYQAQKKLIGRAFHFSDAANKALDKMEIILLSKGRIRQGRKATMKDEYFNARCF